SSSADMFFSSLKRFVATTYSLSLCRSSFFRCLRLALREQCCLSESFGLFAHRLALHRKLVVCETESFISLGLHHTLHFEDDPTGLDHGCPPLDVAFTRTHAG